jgi:hypothetical protein
MQQQNNSQPEATPATGPNGTGVTNITNIIYNFNLTTNGSQAQQQ